MNQIVREAALYSAASACALTVDVGLLWLLVEVARMHYLLAASVAFLTGTSVVYAFSVRTIFRHRRVRDRKLEFSAFVAIGVLGLLVNLAVLKVSVDEFGAHYLVGKLAAIVFTFSLNYGLRRSLLFTAPAAADKLKTPRGPAG
jgi:putative flippase GtrA